MNQKRSLGRQIVYSILYGRFEPVETILALFLAVKGLWISVRQVIGTSTSTSLFGNNAELQITALVFGLLGVIHIVSMYFSHTDGNRWSRWRCNSMFAITLIFLFATVEVIMNIPAGETRWLNWAALTLISGATYLSLVVKR